MSRSTTHDMAPDARRSTTPVLDVRDLRVTFASHGRGSEVHAVDGVSVHVEPGEIVGLVGESGSGKSTLAMSICALGPVTSGSIDVAGHRLNELRGKALRHARADVQMVFQDPHGSLDPRQRIGSGLAELRRLHPHRPVEQDDATVLAQVGLAPGMAQRLPHQLSGGQAQRVSLARAILLQPELLVADEPTSGLDVSVQAQILDLIRHLRDHRRLGVLFISHDLAVVRELCDRAYVMQHGKVVEQGDPARMFTSPEHPYTRRLVDAVPGRGARLMERSA